MGFHQLFKDRGKVSRIWCSATVLKLYPQFDLLKNQIEVVQDKKGQFSSVHTRIHL